VSKHNNANTDYYKTAGRDPQGRNNRQQLAKQDFGTARAQGNQSKGKKKPAK
jgi:hypothetical protein